MSMLSNWQFVRIRFDLWPKHVAHQITGSKEDTTSSANALDLAGRATRDHVELTVLVGKPHGSRNANATLAKGRQQHKLVGRQGGKGVVHLSLLLWAFEGHVLCLSSCCCCFVS